MDNEGLYGVRAELNARGIDNNRIGYDKNTGFVKIDGQNFIKPQNVQQGVSYADPNQFNQAYNTYNTNQNLMNTQNTVQQQMNNPTVNAYDDQVNNTLKQLMDRINNPAQYDPYSSQEYAAYQAQAQRNANQGIRSAQESMGNAGIGRSSLVSDRAQSIQNDANEYMQLQVVPQLLAANQQREQQQIANISSMLNALSQQQGVYDDRTQRELANQMEMLGYYSGQQSRNDSNYQFEKTFVRDTFVDNRNYDRGVFESDRAHNSQQAQIEWENMFKEKQFDEQKASRLWEQAFQEKSFDQSVKQAAAQLGYNYASLNQRQKEFVVEQAFKEKQFEYQQKQDGAGAKYSFKSDPSFAEDIAFINSDPQNAVSEVRKNSQALIQQYGLDGYNELLRAAESATPKTDPLAELLNGRW